MKNKLYIWLNILWNITGLSICYFMFLSIFDFLYIINHRGALDRFRISAYFAPFDFNCHWKKRFPYCKPTRPYNNKDYVNHTTIPITPTISKMTGVEFESFICTLLENLGYVNVKQTSYTNDFGADIIAQKPKGTTFENICIQCKRYTKPVSNTAIQEIYAAKNHYKCETAMVITDSIFTHNAIELANNCGVILWDKNKLNELSNEMNQLSTFEKITSLGDTDSLSYEEIDNYDILDE